jgi:diguanylate cyclase (GGDEF)-like protein
VIVGDATAPEELPQTVIHADNLFDAVGEVTVASSAEPVSAVVVPAPLVQGTARAAAEAFRRIDPSVRLVLLAPSADEPEVREWLADGFDEVVAAPLSAVTVSRIAGGGEEPPTIRNAGPVSVDPEPVASARSPADDAEPAGETPEAKPRAETVVAPGVADLIDAMEPDAAAEAAEAPPQGPLGDTDLVEAILADPAGIRDLALRLIIEQTHWSDLTLTDQPPPGHSTASAEVRFGRRSFGVLSSKQARARQLRPWAAWLARWLALDRGYRDFRTMAFQDELTGAWNRRFYEAFTKKIIRTAARQRRTVTVLVFDLDDFKRYNDEFGHEAGDEVLRETVRLLNSVIRAGDRVCRIGGDEFVVIFGDPEGPREPGSNPPETVEEIAVRFQDQVCQMKFPKLGLDAPGTLSVSGGLATFPWDGTDPESLLRHADQLALESKKKGKNVITLGRGVRRMARDRRR